MTTGSTTKPRDSTADDDFASVLSYGIGSWQSLNWDPAVSDPAVFEYCNNITSDALLYPGTTDLQSDVEELLKVGGYSDEVSALTNRMLNYVGYVNLTAVSGCDQTQDECFTSHNATFYAQDDISQTWRAWPYQYKSCAGGVTPIFSAIRERSAKQPATSDFASD